jgi:hypothetical protein
MRFDARTGRYLTANGETVPATAVRAALDSDIARLTRETARLADELRAGRISLEAWRMEMRTLIKQGHLTAATIARGGRLAMGPAAYGRVGAAVRDEYAYLEAWVDEIRAGWTLDGRLTSRAALYMNAARTTFHQTQAAEMLVRGMTLERSVLHPAEHCAQCVAEAEAGYRPIGVMVPIGERTCGRNCKCTVVYQGAA